MKDEGRLRKSRCLIRNLIHTTDIFILHPSVLILHPFFMRLPNLLLLCLLLVAVFNSLLAIQRLRQLRSLPPALAETHPAAAFAARLDAVFDPAELRRLALARHRTLLDADQTSHTLVATIGTISRTELAQSGIVLLLAGGIYIVSRRPAGP